MRLVFSSIFEQDFADLVKYFAEEETPELALRFEESTYDLIKLLSQHPELGRSPRDIKPDGIRSFRVRGFKRYLLFYRIKGDELVLLRLRYGGMDLQSLFLAWE